MTKRGIIQGLAIGLTILAAIGLMFVGIIHTGDIAHADTTITSTTTTWNGTMNCDDDVTINDNVTVTGTTTVLNIDFDKTLTINGKLTINNGRTLTINGPGNLEITANDVGSSSGAIYINSTGNLKINDGRVTVSATGNSYYGIYVNTSSSTTSTITLNDGALIVNGGTYAGIASHNIVLNRGLLRVRSTGTNDTLTYGILTDDLVVGDSDYLSNRPTLDVLEPSSQSYGVSRYPSKNAKFEYYCGFVEIQADTDAVYCNQLYESNLIEYAGNNKLDASLNTDSLAGTYPYVALAHQIWRIRRTTTPGDYLFTIKSGFRELIFSMLGSVTVPIFSFFDFPSEQ